MLNEIFRDIPQDIEYNMEPNKVQKMKVGFVDDEIKDPIMEQLTKTLEHYKQTLSKMFGNDFKYSLELEVVPKGNALGGKSQYYDVIMIGSFPNDRRAHFFLEKMKMYRTYLAEKLQEMMTILKPKV